MARWERSFIDQVRRSADPVRVVGDIVNLRRRGARFVGLCPFHEEKTPSFSVNDEGLWYCFGCGAGGDLIQFVMQYEGVDFAEAVRTLAEAHGVPVPEQERSPDRSGSEPRIRRERLLEALREADDFYRAMLAGPSGEAARGYLTKRGLDDPTIARFGIGFAPDSWSAASEHLRARGFDEATLVRAGLVRPREGAGGVYDLLRGRVVFPIRDIRGRPIAFSGRILADGEPKYLNSPETPVFAKGRTLYGLGEARESIRQRGFAMLVEGQLDLIACSRHGFENVVAPLGTAFTADHAKLLSRYAEKVVIAFDGDRAGEAAAERTLGVFLEASFQVSIVPLPAGQDPDSFLEENGADELSMLLRRSETALAFLLRRVEERFDLSTPQGKSRALAALLEQVVNIDDRVERAEWIGLVAEALHIEPYLVQQAGAEIRARGRRGREGPSARIDRAPQAASRLEEPPLAERELLRSVLEHPDWLEALRAVYGDATLQDPRIAGLLDAVQACVEEGVEIGADSVLARCDVGGADGVLSRSRLENVPVIDWTYAEGCASGIRRDALRRRLRSIQREIETAVDRGDEDEILRLNREKLTLAQELAAN